MDQLTIQTLRKKANDRRHTDAIARFFQVMAGKIQY